MKAAPQLNPPRSHLARLMSIWRSAGWPSRDSIELDLLAAGWVTYAAGHSGCPTLQITESGLHLLAAARRQRQSALGAHARLTERMCVELVRAGRIVWRELNLRAPAIDTDIPPRDDVLRSGSMDFALAGTAAAAVASQSSQPVWRVARPDVFSVRHTSVEAYLHPAVHEVKVSRADLLSDLRHAAKRASYRSLSCETYYVFPRELAKPEEIPEPYGIVVLDGDFGTGTLEIVRSARHQPCKLPFAVWMALAKASPVTLDEAPRQRELGEPQSVDPATAVAVTGGALARLGA